jgi:hypothetical protein
MPARGTATNRQTAVNRQLAVGRLTASGRLYVDGGGGGGGADMIVTASLPAPGAADTTSLYRLTVDNKLYYTDGVTWYCQGIGQPFVAPVSSQFAWFNQGTSTETAVNGGLLFTAPATTGVSNRMRVQAIPVAPYRIIASMLLNLGSISGTYNPVGGLFISDGVNVTTSKIIRFVNFESQATSGIRTTVSKLTNSTNFSAHYADQPNPAMLQQPLWLMIQDDATNRSFSLSQDGVNWISIFSGLNNDFLVGTHCGYCLETGNTVRAASMNLISYYQGT